MAISGLPTSLIKLVPLLYALIGFGLLIIVHELGHFLFCKLFGVYTPTFSIGMGPTVMEKKLGTTNFKLSLLPLGGYVEIAGAHEIGQGEQTHAFVSDQTAFRSKPFWQKFCILFGGILFNFLLAYSIMIAVSAMGALKTHLTINSVVKDSPAYEAGLESGDLITKINQASSETDLPGVLQELQKIQTTPKPQVSLVIVRNGRARDVSINIPHLDQSELPKSGRLGITFNPEPYLDKNDKPTFFAAVQTGIAKTHDVVEKTYLGLKSIFIQRSLKGTGGPVLIISESTRLAQKGLLFLLIFLAYLSINLGMLNLIPLPILDGGQILFTIIEAIIRREIPDKIKMAIHMTSWALVLLLFLYLTYNDIKALIFG